MQRLTIGWAQIERGDDVALRLDTDNFKRDISAAYILKDRGCGEFDGPCVRDPRRRYRGQGGGRGRVAMNHSDDEFLKVADEMFGAGEKTSLIDESSAQAALHRIGQLVVFQSNLPVEFDQLVGELLADPPGEILFRKSLCAVGSVRPPNVDRQVGKTGIDIDGHVGEQQVVLRLCDVAPRIVDLDLATSFQRRVPDHADLAGEPAMDREVVVFRLYVD